MKRKLLFLILSATATFNVNAQHNQNPNAEGNNFELTSTQGTGYALMGLGAAGIGYAASDIYDEKNPALLYSIGGALILAGLYLVLTGKEDSKPEYWKGMQGYSPMKNFENYFVIVMDEKSRLLGTVSRKFIKM